ncbi:MAG: PqqD family peptide modification chaperone [Phycisphaeraceae bacterium]
MNAPEQPQQPQQQQAAPLPAVRQDLQVSPQLYLGQTVYVVKDPVSLSYFRLQPTEHYIFTQLDGRVTIQELAERVARVFPDEPESPERIGQFVNKLKAAGLLYGRDTDHGQMLRQIEARRRKQRRKAKIIGFLFYKVPVLDPDRLLNWLYRYTSPLMNRATCWVAGLFMAVTAVAVLLHFGEMTTAPAYAILGPTNLALMTATFLGVKVIHEFGHGLAAKHRGLEVHEMGVLFMVFLPLLYVDVTDAWMVERRRDRLWITAGGVYLELLFAAIAGWVWMFSDPGLTNQIALNIMLAASVTTVLFNANPLLRYDGYYFLMDWLETPNLRQKAQNYVGYLCKRYILGMPGQRPSPEAARRPIFMPIFAIAASIYRYFIVLAITGLIWFTLEPLGLEPIAVLLAGAAVATMVVRPVVKTLTFVWQVQARTWRRAAVSVAVIALAGAVTAAILAIPTERHIESPGVVMSEQRRTLYAPATARVAEVFARSGQRIEAGEPILQLDDAHVRDNLAAQRIDLQRLQLQHKLAMREGKHDRAAAVAEQRRELERRIAHLETRLEELTIRAPVTGRLHPRYRLERLRGARLERGEELGQVIGDARPTFVLVMPQSEMGALRPGMPVRVRLWSDPTEALEGELARVGGQLIRHLPHPALAAGAGGEVDVVPDRRYTWAPAEPSVTARVTLSRAASLDTALGEHARVALHDGMTGRGRVLLQQRARLGQQLWQWTRQGLSLDWWL